MSTNRKERSYRTPSFLLSNPSRSRRFAKPWMGSFEIAMRQNFRNTFRAPNLLPFTFNANLCLFCGSGKCFLFARYLLCRLHEKIFGDCMSCQISHLGRAITLDDLARTEAITSFSVDTHTCLLTKLQKGFQCSNNRSAAMFMPSEDNYKLQRQTHLGVRVFHTEIAVCCQSVFPQIRLATSTSFREEQPLSTRGQAHPESRLE